MKLLLSSLFKRSSAPVPMPGPASAAPGTQPSEHAPTDSLQVGLSIGASVLLVGVVASLDLATGPHLSFTVFYLLPVAVCAWGGGFTPGLLLAAIASVAAHAVDSSEHPDLPGAARVWNDVVRFGTLTLVGSLIARLQAGMVRERRLARTDPLTGAANARTFYEAATTEAERARRTDRPLTLAYFDLDDFKRLNDRHGHTAGDEALRQIVRTMRQDLRFTDVLARLGGDEFAVLLPEVNADAAVAILTRIQGAVAQEMFGTDWGITVSIGAVTFLRPPAEV